MNPPCTMNIYTNKNENVEKVHHILTEIFMNEIICLEVELKLSVSRTSR
jgi:hypothetical protein